jgi:hypothetical protein
LSSPETLWPIRTVAVGWRNELVKAFLLKGSEIMLRRLTGGDKGRLPVS